MIRAHHTAPVVDEAPDLLSNYDPPHYRDAVEAALAEVPVSEVQCYPFVTVPPTARVRDVLQTMDDLKVACVVIEDHRRLRGVFTERDVLNRVAENFERLCCAPITSVMTANPLFVYETDSSAAALAVMASFGYRHVPVLNNDDEIVGVVSPQRIMAFMQRYMSR